MPCLDSVLAPIKWEGEQVKAGYLMAPTTHRSKNTCGSKVGFPALWGNRFLERGSRPDGYAALPSCPKGQGDEPTSEDFVLVQYTYLRLLAQNRNANILYKKRPLRCKLERVSSCERQRRFHI